MFDAKFWGPNQMRRRENSEFMAQSLPRPAFPHFHPSDPTAVLEHPKQFHLMLQLGMAQQQNTPTLDTLDGSI